MNVSEKIAAIEARLEAATNLQERIDALADLGWKYLDVDTQKSRELSEQALELSTTGEYETEHYRRGWLHSQRNIGDCLAVTGDYARAMPIAIELLAEAQSEPADPLIQGHALKILGYCFFRLGDYSRALEHNYETLKIADEHGFDELRPRALDSIAFINTALGKTAEAISFSEQAAAQCPDDLPWQASGLNNLAFQYFESGDCEKALVHARESLRICKSNDIERVMSYVLDTLGQIYQKKGEIQTAIEYYEEAVDCARRTDMKAAEIDALRNLGVVCNIVGGQEEASLEYLRRGLALAEEADAKPQLILCHESLSNILAGRGEFEKALDHHRKLANLERVVFSERAEQRTNALQVLHDTETAQKEAEIHRLKNIELQEALDNVKLLSGLLPICAWCKRVRNDDGYWDQIEMYVDKHSEAEFSHSMCPECFEKERSKKPEPA
jgi:tetratricopeptide (TPR) repeat protein